MQDRPIQQKGLPCNWRSRRMKPPSATSCATFYTTKIPAEIRERTRQGDSLDRDDIATSHKILNEHGLAVPNWPVEWGGKDWTPTQHQIWLDEMQLASVPEPLNFNAKMVGPVIAEFGSQETKQRFLPPTASLDIWWCQGFSEPEAGSDLASLRTTALRDGDSYVVNGQKTWTTLGQYADWIFCLVRTDPQAPKKQAGISFLLIDLDTPGITMRPDQADRRQRTRSTRCSSRTSGCPPISLSEKRIKAGPTRSSCWATSGPASRAWAAPRCASPRSKSGPPTPDC